MSYMHLRKPVSEIIKENPLYRKCPLNGLKHLHHNSNTFPVQNMLNFWKEKCKGNDEISFQNIQLKKIYFNLLKEFPEDEAEKKTLFCLLYEIQLESKLRKMIQKTGEWIVFAQINKKNYYLCLATHNEAKEFSDQIIYERLIPCFKEFPEVKNYIT